MAFHDALNKRRSNRVKKGLARIAGLALLKAKIQRAVISCKHRQVPFPHVLLTGLGGTGKTSVAVAIAEELDNFFVRVEAAAFKSRKELVHRMVDASMRAQHCNKTLLFFIDEAHRLSIAMQESLYYPMEEHFVTTANGDISFPPFTLIAATTRAELLDQGSLITRFRRGITMNIGRYENYEIQQIVVGLFKEMGLCFDPEAVKAVADRCLGIPRNARNLAEKVRDQVIYRGGPFLAVVEDCKEVFRLEQLDEIGLSPEHLTLLKILFEAKGQPRGLGLISAKLAMSESAVEDTIEPILLSLGFIDHSPRGRILTPEGHRHLAFQTLI